MNNDPFVKKPAFFPFVSAEVFFESEAEVESEGFSAAILDPALDAELDEILSTEVATESEAA